jgi:hypothetical protein
VWDEETGRRKKRRLGLKFSLLLTISVVVSPHFNLVGLAVLLLPGLVLIAHGWALRAQDWILAESFTLNVRISSDTDNICDVCPFCCLQRQTESFR